MNLPWNRPKNISIKLQSHQVRKLDDVKPGMTVTVDEGIVWLTESNDTQDYALRPGHSVIIRKKGDVLIEAVDKASLHIIYPN
ncbi:MAG: DUF2917 domain-containing protein [Chloroflexi bacterium]|nr:DUF2917 domain-containing protein [Chloroflexota bacterium]